MKRFLWCRLEFLVCETHMNKELITLHLGRWFSNNALDGYCWVWLPASHVLLTQAASLGGALSSMCWNTATCQREGLKGSAQRCHCVKKTVVTSFPNWFCTLSETGKVLEEASQSVKTQATALEDRFSEKGEYCLTRPGIPIGEHLGWFLLLTPLTVHKVTWPLWGSFRLWNRRNHIPGPAGSWPQFRLGEFMESTSGLWLLLTHCG